MLTIKGLSKSFGNTKAVDGLSLEIEGSATVILGPSGCGKTTLLRLIAGLETPDGGEIYLDGKLASNSSYILPPSSRNLGFVFQSPSLWPHMTVAQNILFGLQGLPADRARQRLSELEKTLFLEDFINRYPHQISGGEARRASIARSMAPDPKFLLMDEPLTNMDQNLKMKIMPVICNSISQSETCLIYVTHQIEEANLISGNLLTMEKGRFRQQENRP